MPRAISFGIEGGSAKSRRFATRPPQTPSAGDGGAACQHWDKLVNLPRSGGVVERSIAPVLKTGDPQGSVGSNPTPSAIRRSRLNPSCGMRTQFEPETGRRRRPIPPPPPFGAGNRWIAPSRRDLWLRKSREGHRDPLWCPFSLSWGGRAPILLFLFLN